MKKLKRIAAVVLTGAMALTMLAGCGGGSSSGSNSNKVSLINLMLARQQSSADEEAKTVQESSELTKAAEEYVEWIAQAKEVPTTVANDEDAYYEAKSYDQYIDDVSGQKRLTLYNNNILIYDVGTYSCTRPDGPSSDEALAKEVSYIIHNIENGYYDESDEWQVETYWPGNGRDDVELTGCTVKSIGIASASDINSCVYANSCADGLGHVEYGSDYYNANDNEKNYFAHTEEFNGWIVMIQIER